MPIRSLAFAIYGLALLLPSFCQAQKTATNAPSTTPSAPIAPATAPAAAAAPVDPSSQAIAAAMARMDANDLDGALAKLTEAIQLNPKDSGPYVFRASVYCQKKLWPQAEADFKSAAQISPKNIVIQFNLVELKFMQKQYDLARPGYLALESDPEMGDLAAYKVFLCDLLAGHEALAHKELAALDKVVEGPSYYFGNAAWSLVHKNPDDARGWLVSAANIYPSGKIAYYATCLRDLGYLPLPAPTPK